MYPPWYHVTITPLLSRRRPAQIARLLDRFNGNARAVTIVPKSCNSGGYSLRCGPLKVRRTYQQDLGNRKRFRDTAPLNEPTISSSYRGYGVMLRRGALASTSVLPRTLRIECSRNTLLRYTRDIPTPLTWLGVKAVVEENIAGLDLHSIM